MATPEEKQYSLLLMQKPNVLLQIIDQYFYTFKTQTIDRKTFYNTITNMNHSALCRFIIKENMIHTLGTHTSHTKQSHNISRLYLMFKHSTAFVTQFQTSNELINKNIHSIINHNTPHQIQDKNTMDWLNRDIDITINQSNTQECTNELHNNQSAPQVSNVIEDDTDLHRINGDSLSLPQSVDKNEIKENIDVIPAQSSDMKNTSENIDDPVPIVVNENEIKENIDDPVSIVVNENELRVEQQQCDDHDWKLVDSTLNVSTCVTMPELYTTPQLKNDSDGSQSESQCQVM